MIEIISRRNLIQLAGCGALLRGQTAAAEAAAAATLPNQPIGIAKGLYPGRVVWTHERKAATWGGSGDGHWWEDRSTNETLVDSMMSIAIRELGGESSEAAAWDAMIKHFNQARGQRRNRIHKRGEGNYQSESGWFYLLRKEYR